MKNTKLIQAAMRVVKAHPEFRRALTAELQKKADKFSIEAAISRALNDILTEMAIFFAKKHDAVQGFNKGRLVGHRTWQMESDVTMSPRDATLILWARWTGKHPEVGMSLDVEGGRGFSWAYPFDLSSYPSDVVMSAGTRLNKDFDDWIYKHSS